MMMIMILSLWSRSCGHDMLAGSADKGRSAAASDFTRPVDIMGFSHLLKVLYVYTHNTNFTVRPSHLSFCTRHNLSALLAAAAV